MAGLAILSLVYGNFAPLVEAFPAWLPWPEVWPYGLGVLLLAAGAGLFVSRTAPVSVLVIGIYELVWAATRVRPVFVQPLNVGSWYGICEALGPLAAAWILYTVLRRPANGTALTGDRALRVPRAIFGGACIGYGAAHFAYAAYTASMVPGWLPDRTGLAYLTGVAHTAAGLGLLVGILPRLAATLEAIMMSLFGVLVWWPSFFAHPVPAWALPKQVQWSETLLTFLLAASAWIVAASAEPARSHREDRPRL